MTDLYSRFLLTLVAVALCLGIALDMGWIRPAEPTATDEPSPARFRLVPLLAVRQVLLLDGETGNVWRASLEDAGGFERVRRPGPGKPDAS